MKLPATNIGTTAPVRQQPKPGPAARELGKHPMDSYQPEEPRGFNWKPLALLGLVATTGLLAGCDPSPPTSICDQRGSEARRDSLINYANQSTNPGVDKGKAVDGLMSTDGIGKNQCRVLKALVDGNGFDGAFEAVLRRPGLNEHQADVLTYLATAPAARDHFSEERAFGAVLQQSNLTELQARHAISLHANASRQNEIPEERALGLLLHQTRLNEPQTDVLDMLVMEGNTSNRFQESRAYEAVIQRQGLSQSKARELSRIFRQGGPGSTELFLQSLQSR